MQVNPAPYLEQRIVHDEVHWIRNFALGRLPENDIETFVSLILRELHHLTEGNIARYRLRLGQFLDWQRARQG